MEALLLHGHRRGRRLRAGPELVRLGDGTGIIANAAASLPLFSERLQAFAVVTCCLAALMLGGLVLATSGFLFRRQNAWKRHFHTP